jgi:hypothetical protein
MNGHVHDEVSDEIRGGRYGLIRLEVIQKVIVVLKMGRWVLSFTVRA